MSLTPLAKVMINCINYTYASHHSKLYASLLVENLESEYSGGLYPLVPRRKVPITAWVSGSWIEKPKYAGLEVYLTY